MMALDYNCLINYLDSVPPQAFVQANIMQTHLNNNGMPGVTVTPLVQTASEGEREFLFKWNTVTYAAFVPPAETGPGLLQSLPFVLVFNLVNNDPTIRASLVLDPAAQDALISFLAGLGATFTPKAVACTVVILGSNYDGLLSQPGVIGLRNIT
jgi:hypothetical protein